MLLLYLGIHILGILCIGSISIESNRVTKRKAFSRATLVVLTIELVEVVKKFFHMIRYLAISHFPKKTSIWHALSTKINFITL